MYVWILTALTSAMDHTWMEMEVIDEKVRINEGFIQAVTCALNKPMEKLKYTYVLLKL